MTNRTKIFGIGDAIQQFGTPHGGREIESLYTPESFFEFTRDIWSQSDVYDHPEYFSEWHVNVVCDDMQWCLENNVNYACMMPRGHLKSTICYAFLCWLMLRSDRPSDPFYLSYNYTMAAHHMGEIKRIIESNPKLSPYFVDSTARNARFSFRYKIHNKFAEISPGGVFSFRRGRHTNTALIADDLLKDPTDPLDATQVERVENVFFSEHIYIPNKNVITVVVGTPMAPRDLFYKLRSDDRFFFRALPVRYPVPDRPILAPGIRDAKWLDNMEKGNPSAFATEMMLAPRLSEDAYITENELLSCEDSTLESLDTDGQEHILESTCTVGGFDIGKRRHPSHLSIYRTDPTTGEAIQVCQKWLDGWSYEDQISLLNNAVINFGIDRGYFDGTRGEFDERNLDPVWRPVSLQTKTQKTVAQSFETGVCSGKLRMIENERQHNQIIAVNVDLRAAETTLGHGESFWSNALALHAHKEMTGGFGPTIETVGDLGTLASQTDIALPHEFNRNTLVYEFACPNCGHKAGWIEEHKKCMVCFVENLPDIMYHPNRKEEEMPTQFFNATTKKTEK